MARVQAKAYPSPSVVLLAFSWQPAEEQKAGFLGFAIRRSPGFRHPSSDQPSASDWLLNRVTFAGVARDRDVPTSVAPIQKFMWWDARFHFPEDQGQKFTYEIFPVVGQPGQPQRLEDEKETIEVTIPHNVENGVGTWFNRAVTSSQAFSRQVSRLGGATDGGVHLTDDQALELRRWLANGMETVIPDFVRQSGNVDGAIYHLTDELWIIPALKDRNGGTTALVYDATKAGAQANANALQELEGVVEMFPRTKANIMHNKVLTLSDGEQPAKVLTGSANFTTEGLTSQANVLHTWGSPELAGIYRNRIQLLKQDPPLKQLGDEAKWSDPVQVGDASVQVIFSPEATKARASIDAVVEAIGNAKASVLFCLFSPTDDELRNACFEAGDRGLMMFGLVNKISVPKQNGGENPNAAELAAVELYHRSRKNRDVIGAAYLRPQNAPRGFVREMELFPGEKRPKFPPVIIHHKFIVVDGETEGPVIFTGSANMSNNSLHKNDENLLQVRGAPSIARVYLAEFFRLYEHYRFRFSAGADLTKSNKELKLNADGSWADKYFKSDTPEYKSRVGLLAPTA